MVERLDFRTRIRIELIIVITSLILLLVLTISVYYWQPSSKMSGPAEPVESNEKESSAQHEVAEKVPYHEGIEAINAIEERRLLWKIDLHLLPPLIGLYMLAFLDRINIGNAKIQNMTEDLKMVGNDYSIALFIFFIP